MALLLAGMLFMATATEDVHDLALEAAVDPVDLQGAVNTTGLDARAYLYMTGELKRPAAPQIPYGIWDSLAVCESGQNGVPRWHINAYHDGGLQFHPQTWSAHKPPGYPAYAYQATREQQIVVGQRVQATQGWRAWPVCSRRIGMR